MVTASYQERMWSRQGPVLAVECAKIMKSGHCRLTAAERCTINDQDEQRQKEMVKGGYRELLTANVVKRCSDIDNGQHRWLL